MACCRQTIPSQRSHSDSPCFLQNLTTLLIMHAAVLCVCRKWWSWGHSEVTSHATLWFRLFFLSVCGVSSSTLQPSSEHVWASYLGSTIFTGTDVDISLLHHSVLPETGTREERSRNKSSGFCYYNLKGSRQKGWVLKIQSTLAWL